MTAFEGNQLFGHRRVMSDETCDMRERITAFIPVRFQVTPESDQEALHRFLRVLQRFTLQLDILKSF